MSKIIKGILLIIGKNRTVPFLSFLSRDRIGKGPLKGSGEIERRAK